MFRLLLMLLVAQHRVLTIVGDSETRTLFGHSSDSDRSVRTFTVSADADVALPNRQRNKRDVLQPQPVITNVTVQPRVTHLNDTHKQMMVHWVGEGSNVIICLARDPTPVVLGVNVVTPSSVFISYDYGDTYENKTELFKLPNGSYATLEKFYNHPKYNTHFVFSDIRNRFLFVTANHGKDIKRIQPNFTPSEIAFHELQPAIFAVLDKDDPEKKLFITENFGNTFRVAQMFVKSFFWLQDDKSNLQLVVQRYEASGLNTIMYSSLFKSKDMVVYDSTVKDFYVKENYLFTTKNNTKSGKLDLYISYKLGKKLQCVFGGAELDIKGYYIVDVSNDRALIAASHTDTMSHLYVSDNLSGSDGKVHFTLSLEAVFCYMPNTTWHESWLSHLSDDAFADVYKVEPISGIFIASQVIGKPMGHNIGPQHLASVISFDHGATWRPIKAPLYDEEGQQTACQLENNCSLHLSQKFAHYYPDIRSIGILSSKSAPGLIIATGVIGKHMKGHYGVFVSSDAGVTWHQALKDLYFFNMGDHGGVLTAVKYFHGNTKTRHVLYSTDEGEKWSRVQFYTEDIRLYGLMTEPGENTTIFTMFGSAPSVHQWIIIKLDLKSVFAYNCTKDDYKTWSPGQDENQSYIPCVMGQQLTYQRRMPHSNCYNGEDYDTPVAMRPCNCDAIDFECELGFIRVPGNPGYCIRNKSTTYDPYELPKSCKPGQFYNRTKGYRKISGDVCENGFEKQYLPDVIPCPFKEVQQFLLFAQRERICRFDLAKQELQELPIKNLKNVIAIDFDMKNNCVYWADIVSDTIGRQCLDSGKQQEILVSSDLASIEGLAFDWISNNLYFVDGTRAKIEMIRTDISHSGRMRRTVLDQGVLKKPRGIALHPRYGYLYWTDWAAEKPSISRSNLDGTNIRTLFTKPTVEWPNGITVDHIAERVYWVDGKQDYIASCNLEGQSMKKILHGVEVVSHPFAIAVFKNDMYWDDWKNNALYIADKDHGIGIEALLRNLPGLMDLKIYAHSLQDETNDCVNATCSYLCVGAPKGHVCLCPDGMEFVNGQCLCPGNVTHLDNMTCPKVNKTCSASHMTCDNGACIPKGWKCDGENDCGDNSDERYCGAQSCLPNYHTCGDGKCIPYYWKCDFEKDCLDGSDELNCPKQNCTADQFACNNGRCISSRWKCDRENDCADGSDEQGCEEQEPAECKVGEFKCLSGAVKCIPLTWKCDGENDCRDSSDELSCDTNKCLDTQFSCGPPNNRCIYTTWVCDGDQDCQNGNDEKNCSTTITGKLAISVVTPKLFDQMNGTCHAWMFTCANKKCVPNWWKCDTADDCGDGSDELDCPMVPSAGGNTNKNLTSICGHNQFHCSSGECISAGWVCDGSIDCSNGDDESNCDAHPRCTSDEFKCRMDGSCIPFKDVCNEHVDCPDGSDESICEHNFPSGPATPSCSWGFFPCDISSCHPLASLCDGKADCTDGYDEKDCDNSFKRVYQVLQMGIDDRSTNESSLYLYWWIPTPNTPKLQFMPSISRMGTNKWKNESWTDTMEHLFVGLQPFTKYNMTVYVRIANTSNVFPPAKYLIAQTKDGQPSEPWNVTVEQRNGSHVLVSWNPPIHPNGEIDYYMLCFSPPVPPLKLVLYDNSTSHMLLADFKPAQKYSFYVIAHNKHFESKRSEIKTLVFDGETDVDSVNRLNVTSITNQSISLMWEYNRQADGFNVTIGTDPPYPKMLPRTTSTNSIVIDNLAPGANYIFSVYAFRKTFRGPEMFITARTIGTPLPEVDAIDAILVPDLGTTVKLSWNRPKDSRKVSWVYGVYYGLDNNELVEMSRLNTTDLTATVSQLQACEYYMFSVGIVGPYGLGPVSWNLSLVRTHMNKRAPPKNLRVDRDPDDALVINVSWSPSCAADKTPLKYLIRVHEQTRNKITTVTVQNLTHTFQTHYGAVYEIAVAVDVLGSEFCDPYTYYAPPLLPPLEVDVIPQANGTYIVTWSRRDTDDKVGAYKYEVLVSEGPEMKEETAMRFEVDGAPFFYTNDSSDTYTFAVRVKTEKGFQSMLSESLSARLVKQMVPDAISKTSLTWILVPTLMLIVILVVILGILFVRHRRLQNSFTRFANSHYDTRSGAATFDDNSLEEEEHPQIRGFSDDEPLVIA